MYLPEQLQHGEDGVRQEGEPENQVNLLVHNVHWQGTHSRNLYNEFKIFKLNFFLMYSLQRFCRFQIKTFWRRVQILGTLEREFDTPNKSIEHITTRGNTCMGQKSHFTDEFFSRKSPQLEQPAALRSWKYWNRSGEIVVQGTCPWRTAVRGVIEEKDRLEPQVEEGLLTWPRLERKLAAWHRSNFRAVVLNQPLWVIRKSPRLATWVRTSCRLKRRDQQH